MRNFFLYAKHSLFLLFLSCLFFAFLFNHNGQKWSLIFANGPGRGGGTGQQFGEDIMQAVLDHFATIQTIDSNVRLKVALFGNEYRGNGIYLEKRDGEEGTSPLEQMRRLFLLELKFQSSIATQPGSDSNTLKIVCNRENVWRYSSTEGLHRVEIKELIEAIAQSEKKDEFGNLGDMGNMPFLGGLEGTLRSMRKNYAFSLATVESAQLGSQALGVWKMTVPIKEDTLQKMLHSLGVKDMRNSELTAQIPTAVVLYVGKEDFFPYRIDYFRGPYDQINWNHPFIQQEYYNVALNTGGVDDGRFRYSSSGESVILEEKGTEKYLQKLGL